jgi:hypothetical protein
MALVEAAWTYRHSAGLDRMFVARRVARPCGM